MSYFRKINVAGKNAHAFPGGIVEGALVRTPDGVRQIERIRPGDRIATRDAGQQPVRRIWCREVSVEQMQADRRLAPVCVPAEALGAALPHDKTLLARHHKVLLPSYLLEGDMDCTTCLVEIGDLLGRSGPITPEPPRRTARYYTVIFDNHQIFCANGLAVESFHVSPCSLNRLCPELRQDLLGLFSDIKTNPDTCARVGYELIRGKLRSGN